LEIKNKKTKQNKTKQIIKRFGSNKTKKN